MRIRNPLLYSLLLNGVLGGPLGYKGFLISHPVTIAAVQPPPPIIPQPPEASSEAEPAAPAPEPFQWSTLEAADYPTYLANLRKIGCPEQTIQDILLADISALYAQKRAALDAKGLDPLGLCRAMSALQEEESLLLNRLLGIPMLARETSSVAQEQTPLPSASASSPSVSQVPRQTTAPIPMVFQPVDPGALKLTDQQKILLERLRQTFVQEIGGPNQNPNDPRYLERWEQAQMAADSQLKTLFGNDIFSLYQVESLRQMRK